MLAGLRSRLAAWRRRRYLKRHPEPHHDRSVPRRERLADPIDRGGKAPPNIPPI